MSMADTTVLVLGEHALLLSSLADRIRDLGFRAIRAKTPQEALDLATERGYRFDAVLIDAGVPALDLPAALANLRMRAGAQGINFLATGVKPCAEECARLREAGVLYALWEPVGNHAMRFQLNRATTHDPGASLREEQRVPTEWKTRVTVGGRPKPASVYSLSGGGAFLATARPSMRGAEMAVDLPLPGGTISVLARVLYTNVPGNLARSHLPSGMGVRFIDTPMGDRRAIDHQVSEVAVHYLV
ncbi:MAG: PilZ domain-containing protein [Deltaproteobacteria bacterium]|nr:PilZ domain-containing protein [Deltaproteobacteria bacterium]MBW2382252.1 PilZ domain-containing protein [Deltaproteobacteria bacterium]MBW2697023.1 PilZ domain-containing protein [Deltaproteobacteria bacterium]